MDMKKVIILTGMPGSGKSTAALEFSNLNVPVIGMGDAIRKEKTGHRDKQQVAEAFFKEDD